MMGLHRVGRLAGERTWFWLDRVELSIEAGDSPQDEMDVGMSNENGLLLAQLLAVVEVIVVRWW